MIDPLPGPLVELRGVSLKLASLAGQVNVLNDVDLEVGAGEALGIVGPSGSGKSTLLMVIGGLERPDAGIVRVAGRDLTKLSEDQAADLRLGRVGIVFQSFQLLPGMTALENVAAPLELAGDRNAMDKAREQLRAVGLAHRLDHYPTQLSGGEQQRTALARAVVGRPALLLADEPTGNLDQSTGAEIADLMFDLHKSSGMALVLVTHDPDLAARCGRAVHLRDGKVV